MYGYSASLSEATWSEIDTISSLGVADDYWSVGDTKNITLTTAETLTTEIVGFNHDDLTSGGKAPISFDLKYLFDEVKQIDAYEVQDQDWTFLQGEFERWINEELINLLPSDLLSVIKPVNKKFLPGNYSYTPTIKSEKLFFLSVSELGLELTVGYDHDNYQVYNQTQAEGQVYPLFSTTFSRIKKVSNADGVSESYWTRTTRPSMNYPGLIFVDENGNMNNSWAPAPTEDFHFHRVCFGFCV